MGAPDKRDKPQTSWLFTHAQRLERYSWALGYDQNTCCAGLGKRLWYTGLNCYLRNVIRQNFGQDAGLGTVYLTRITICHLSSLNSYNVLWVGYSKLMNGLIAATASGAWSADVRDYY